MTLATLHSIAIADVLEREKDKERALARRKVFAAVLKARHRESGLSLRELGAFAGVSTTYLHDLQSGRRGPPHVRVANALDRKFEEATKANAAAVQKAIDDPAGRMRCAPADFPEDPP